MEADVLYNVGNERANQFGSVVCLGKQLGLFLVDGSFTFPLSNSQ